MIFEKRARAFSKSKRGQVSLPLLIGFVIFNLIWYIIVIAFTNDNVQIGTASNVFETQVNATGTDIAGSTATTTGVFSWVSRFFINVFSMPWWMTAIVGFGNGIMLFLILLGIIRGL